MSFFFSGMPGFGQMGGDDMGGFGSMGSGGGGGEEVDNKKYYELLGLEKNASPNDIKKKYKVLARELHPDKHPEDPETYQKKFQELQAAYEVLSDPDKRKLYDRFGEQGLKGGGGQSMTDIFDMFLGGRGRQQRERKSPPIKLPVDVTLEDLYIGATKEISFKRFQICKGCDGKGGKKVMECAGCKGSGVQVVMQKMGFMTMQSQRPCPQCRGEGQSIPEGDRCKKCDGKKTKEENHKMEFNIPVGSKHADQVILKGYGHELPDVPTGDVVVILRCEKHETFQRIGADLAMNFELSLKEALCGYDIKIRHLSKTILHLKSNPGEVVQPGQLKVVYGKGMPQKGSSHVKGNLYIKFEVTFPKTGSLHKEAITKMSTLLPDQEIKRDEDFEMNEDKKSPKKGAKKPEKGDKQQQGEGEEEEEEEDLTTENVEAEDVEGEPGVTPASAKSTYDEDEEQESSSCRQM